MEDKHFKIIDENNKEVECHMLHEFKKDNNSYIIYTDHTFNDNGELNVSAFKYKIENDSMIPIDITDENEWNMINEEWSKINE